MDKQRERGALVREVQRGNRVAYDRLFQLEYPWSYKTARKIARNDADAEELAARAWSIIWKKRCHLPMPEAFRGYLRRIMLNLFLEELRARERRGGMGESLHLVEECCEDLRDPARLDPVCTEALFRATDLTVAYERLAQGLLALQADLSPSAATLYREIVAHVARYRWAEPRTLRAHLAEELHLSRNAASMRLLEIFKKAARRGLPLESILADAELTGAARPVFRRVARQWIDDE